MIRRACITVVAALMVGSSLVVSGEQDQAQPSEQPSLAVVAAARDVSVYPPTLNDFLDEFGSQQVRLPVSRVVEVLGPRALVVEPIGKWSKTVPWLDRVLVLVPHGAFKADPEALDATDVRVRGEVRTPLGIQLSGEFPWPRELTRKRTESLGVRAAILATSVQTTDGVELTSQRFTAPATARKP